MAERTSVLSILGRPVAIDTATPFRPVRQTPITSLLSGIQSGIGTVAGIDALRTNRELRKRKLRDMDIEFEKQQQAMDVIRNAIELDPSTGMPSINRSKLVNGMIEVDPQRGIQLMQTLTEHDFRQAQINEVRLKDERERLKAARAFSAQQEKSQREQRRLDIAEEGLALRQRTAETPAQKLERSRQLGVAAAEVEKSAKPLTGEAAKSVAQLDTLLEMSDDVEALFDEKFVGQVTGRLGAAREFTGEIAEQEVEFRRVTRDIKDMLLRARSGAQINEQEFKRLSNLTPSPEQPAKVFKARLRGFRRAVRQLRENRVRIATTGRGSLAGTGEDLETDVRPPALESREQEIIQQLRELGLTDDEIEERLR